jgi:hypothetical protein
VVAAIRLGDEPHRQPPGIADFALIRATTARVTDAVADSRKVFIDVPTTPIPQASIAALTFQSAIAYALRRKDIAFAISQRVAKEMGAEYYPSDEPHDAVISIAGGELPTNPRGRVLVRAPQVTVTLSHRRGRHTELP